MGTAKQGRAGRKGRGREEGRAALSPAFYAYFPHMTRFWEWRNFFLCPNFDKNLRDLYFFPPSFFKFFSQRGQSCVGLVFFYASFPLSFFPSKFNFAQMFLQKEFRSFWGQNPPWSEKYSFSLWQLFFIVFFWSLLKLLQSKVAYYLTLPGGANSAVILDKGA